MELAPDLVTLARKGDRAAQSAFVEMYQDRVYAVCLALAGPDGEDCAQEALVAALAGLSRFDPQGPARLGTFVIRIARNRCIDRARAARLRTWTDVEVDRLAGPIGHGGDPHAVRAAVLALPDDQRAVIALRTWGELEYDEIAAVLAIPIGTVRSRLARAREALRSQLSALAPARATPGGTP